MQHPDLILTDVLLPKMNGYEFVKELKNCSFTANIPILVMTGRGQMKEVFDAAGVAGFISKPFHPKELISKIHEILSIQEITSLSQENVEKKKHIVIVGRKEFEDILNDVLNIVQHLNCDGKIVFSVSEGVAAAVEFSSDAFLVDVQLDGKHSAEFVNIIRHLPGFEEKPIVGFCYYLIALLSDPLLRKKISFIDEDVERFLQNGANIFLGRYSREVMIAGVKDNILLCK
jgi:DNA-binding response OmpR family regulator